MRRMSFALTERQLLSGEKTVTRRLGWRSLEPGTQLLAVNKCMGLKKGEKARVLGTIIVNSVRREPLFWVSKADAAREGFPDLSVDEFIEMFCKAMKCTPMHEVTRIEFEKVKP